MRVRCAGVMVSASICPRCRARTGLGSPWESRQAWTAVWVGWALSRRRATVREPDGMTRRSSMAMSGGVLRMPGVAMVVRCTGVAAGLESYDMG